MLNAKKENITKFLLMILMLVPMMCFAEERSMQMQMLDNEIERLAKQRDEKYQALQDCEKKTQGFKIAGITTLVATGVGVYGNIKLSQKLDGKKGQQNSANSVAVVDDRPQEERNDDSCELLCGLGAAPESCNC